MGAVFLVLFLIPTVFGVIDFISILAKKKSIFHPFAAILYSFFLVLALPALYLSALDQGGNDCCSDSATFSPEHRISVYVLIILCIVFYFYSVAKTTIYSPIFEVLTNCFLLIGIVFNVFIAIQIGPLSLLVNPGIIVAFLAQLIKNHWLFIAYKEENDLDTESRKPLVRWAWKILNLPIFYKMPLLFVLALPVLSLLAAFLLLFGQKPDSFIRAFTDTYKHGFSQLDYMCDNVTCGGHFLCSVAAKGHQKLVRPQRLGERAGNPILCNRQLLIANAFEEWVEEHFPRLHRFVRRRYNKVGNMIHRYYGIFNNKFVADFIYIIMKPLEWLFLFVLYAFDKKPENRIASQYLKPTERKKIAEILVSRS